MTTTAHRKTGTRKPRGRPAPRASDGVFYPYSTGEPMGESNAHLQCIRWILDALEDLLRDRPDVSVHGDMFWYWQEGRPDLTRAPDAMVFFGVPMDPVRKSFKSWEHGGAVPDVIIETASAAQKALLFGDMLRDYQGQCVREYFVFDWSGQYLDQPLYGYRLRGARYQPIRPRADGGLVSNQLRAVLRPDRRMLRFLKAADDSPILTRLEQVAAARAQADATSQEVAQKDAELKRALALLRKAGIDPDAPK
jgi:Uma2 family endonuclease